MGVDSPETESSAKKEGKKKKKKRIRDENHGREEDKSDDRIDERKKKKKQKKKQLDSTAQKEKKTEQGDDGRNNMNDDSNSVTTMAKDKTTDTQEAFAETTPTGTATTNADETANVGTTNRKENKKQNKKKRSKVEEEDDRRNSEDRTTKTPRKKRKRSTCSDEDAEREAPEDENATTATKTAASDQTKDKKEDAEEVLPKAKTMPPLLTFDHKYIMAPMVGASELAFRMLCRKYGTQLAYTPMMIASKFVADAKYREQEFQTIPQDRPLVCHFAANNPDEFAAAARLVADQCDAVDLNLGCPQRTAYVGHFGSYLLDPPDRSLICDMIGAAARAVPQTPIFCKIRLLSSLGETLELCRQLRNAGASLICIHARHRASFERKGPGARDGPAMLDQVRDIQRILQNESPPVAIITNGNTITFDHVEENLCLTQAHGLMSAEGILDDPALFLPRWGRVSTEEEKDANKEKKDMKDTHSSTLIRVPALSYPPSSPTNDQRQQEPTNGEHDGNSTEDEHTKKQRRKWTKKLREIEALEEAQRNGRSLGTDQMKKLTAKSLVLEELAKLETNGRKTEKKGRNPAKKGKTENDQPPTLSPITMKDVALPELYRASRDSVGLALEYLSYARQFPTQLRTVVFHTRRICKGVLNDYQLMQECVTSESVEDVEAVLRKCRHYQENPSAFAFNAEKARQEKLALERKRHEEGKRKAFEARMMRRAKREGLADVEHYLRRGAAVPTWELVQKLRKLPHAQQMELWKRHDHSQHCLAHHVNGCARGDRACAFLHVEAKRGDATTSLLEVSEEIAG